jgi:hypothetical protein
MLKKEGEDKCRTHWVVQKLVADAAECETAAQRARA